MKTAGKPTASDRVHALASATTGMGELGGPPDNWSAEGRQLWNEIVGTMPPKVLQRADGLTVTLLVDAVIFYRRARKALDEQGETIETSKSVYRNPAAVAVNQHAARIRGLCSDLGMSPTARARIGLVMDVEVDGDDFGDLIPR